MGHKAELSTNAQLEGDPTPKRSVLSSVLAMFRRAEARSLPCTLKHRPQHGPYAFQFVAGRGKMSLSCVGCCVEQIEAEHKRAGGA